MEIFTHAQIPKIPKTCFVILRKNMRRHANSLHTRLSWYYTYSSLIGTRTLPSSQATVDIGILRIYSYIYMSQTLGCTLIGKYIFFYHYRTCIYNLLLHRRILMKKLLLIRFSFQYHVRMLMIIQQCVYVTQIVLLANFIQI